MTRNAAIWGAVLLAIAVPVIAAARSPLLAWRDGVYITAGFAGVIALALLLLQPLLMAGALPGLSGAQGRRAHRWVGSTLLLAVLLHVGGLWRTSPPDVVDALLLVSPTPFSVWGVAAMWALFAAAGVAMLRTRLPLRTFRRGHSALALIITGGTIVHALLIQGTMEPVTKAVLCALALLALLYALHKRRVWPRRNAKGGP